MKTGPVLKTIGKTLADPLETIRDQAINPMWEEATNELGLNFFDRKNRLSQRPQEIAKDDLSRAREEERIQQLNKQTDEESTKGQAQIIESIKRDYTSHQNSMDNQDRKLSQEVEELQQEVAALAKTAGAETKAHLQNNTKKVGKLDIKLLTVIIKFLRFKAEESKSAQELVSQRSNSKRTTGMLAWVSGKQMKIHEQGTLTLQG